MINWISIDNYCLTQHMAEEEHNLTVEQGATWTAWITPFLRVLKKLSKLVNWSLEVGTLLCVEVDCFPSQIFVHDSMSMLM